MALGEVGRRDAPAPPAAEQGARVEDRERGDPERDARRAGDEAGHQEEPGGERGRRREAPERPAQGRVALGGERVEPEVEQAHEHVGDPEEHGLGAEGAGDGEGDQEHRGHRPEHARPDRARLGLQRVREPGVARPGPPQGGEDEQAAAHPRPGGVVRHELGHLGEGVDEDEVEEVLQRGDPLLPLGHRGRLRRGRDQYRLAATHRALARVPLAVASPPPAHSVHPEPELGARAHSGQSGREGRPGRREATDPADGQAGRRRRDAGALEAEGGRRRPNTGGSGIGNGRGTWSAEQRWPVHRFYHSRFRRRSQVNVSTKRNSSPGGIRLPHGPPALADARDGRARPTA